ncbi:pectinesterase inhibitor 9-like [Vigna radiata var. radiata]|uniref:Pectinesterase inhibitor 9-like n=1 Tax=Vigna radiata var. radiata TaxID=3916 RepID=A0A1S3THF1_VIGRR|nr:pectinesterase inhibitor 9-like [Vigna radiata var. radiata]
MATTVRLVSLLLMNLVIYMSSTAQCSITKHADPNPAEFVKSSCRATRYPVLCVHSLLAYAGVIHRSDRQLAMTALSVSISRTRSSALFLKKMSKARSMKGREWRAVQDCVETIGDSVERLKQSVRELGRTGLGEDFAWHMSNVQTWVSAALTDDNTCLDGFAGSAMNGNVKSDITERVIHVAQVTSNALALVNRFASTHATHSP